MAINKGKGNDANVSCLDDFFIDCRLILEEVGSCTAASRTRGDVEVVHNLAEENSHEWEWDASSGGAESATDDEKMIDPCRLDSKEKLKPEERAIERLNYRSVRVLKMRETEQRFVKLQWYTSLKLIGRLTDLSLSNDIVLLFAFGVVCALVFSIANSLAILKISAANLYYSIKVKETTCSGAGFCLE
jgi:hypothetical protein